MNNNLVTVEVNVKDFIFAGNCLFTVANMRSGNHYTFQVQAPDQQKNPEDPVHFVKVLSGPDNHDDYQMIGMIFSAKKYVHWNKSLFTKDCPSEVAFVWLVAQLLRGSLPSEVKVFHHGYCGRCGALLTTPESIQRGLGPTCAAKSMF
jgi:hypothetical protein